MKIAIILLTTLLTFALGSAFWYAISRACWDAGQAPIWFVILASWLVLSGTLKGLADGVKYARTM